MKEILRVFGVITSALVWILGALRSLISQEQPEHNSNKTILRNKQRMKKQNWMPRWWNWQLSQRILHQVGASGLGFFSIVSHSLWGITPLEVVVSSHNGK
jgi:hypothetical protein